MRCEVPGEISNNGAAVRASHLDQPAALIHLDPAPAQHSMQSPDVGASLHEQLLMWMGITGTFILWHFELGRAMRGNEGDSVLLKAMQYISMRYRVKTAIFN